MTLTLKSLKRLLFLPEGVLRFWNICEITKQGIPNSSILHHKDVTVTDWLTKDLQARDTNSSWVKKLALILLSYRITEAPNRVETNTSSNTYLLKINFYFIPCQMSTLEKFSYLRLYPQILFFQAICAELFELGNLAFYLHFRTPFKWHCYW